MLYAISAGPLTTQASRRAVQSALNAAPPPVITVRDRLGYRLLEDVGVTQDIHLTADPAFLLEPEELSIDALKAEGVDFDRPLIGFSVREPGPGARYRARRVLRAARERRGLHGRTLRRQHSVRADGEDRRSAQPRGRGSYAERGAGGDPTAPLLATSNPGPDGASGVRGRHAPSFFHFAALRGIPFAALPYVSKVTGLLEDLDMPTPPLGSIGIGQLIARIDRSWDTRAKLRTKIRERLPSLRARAQETNRLLLELIEKAGRDGIRKRFW